MKLYHLDKFLQWFVQNDDFTYLKFAIRCSIPINMSHHFQKHFVIIDSGNVLLYLGTDNLNQTNGSLVRRHWLYRKLGNFLNVLSVDFDWREMSLWNKRIPRYSWWSYWCSESRKNLVDFFRSSEYLVDDVDDSHVRAQSNCLQINVAITVNFN